MPLANNDIFGSMLVPQWFCAKHYHEYYQQSGGMTGLPDVHVPIGKLTRMWIVTRMENLVLESPRYVRAQAYCDREIGRRGSLVPFVRAAYIADRVTELIGLPICCTIPPDDWQCLLATYSKAILVMAKTGAFLEEPT